MRLHHERSTMQIACSLKGGLLLSRCCDWSATIACRSSPRVECCRCTVNKSVAAMAAMRSAMLEAHGSSTSFNSCGAVGWSAGSSSMAVLYCNTMPAEDRFESLRGRDLTRAHAMDDCLVRFETSWQMLRRYMRVIARHASFSKSTEHRLQWQGPRQRVRDPVMLDCSRNRRVHAALDMVGSAVSLARAYIY